MKIDWGALGTVAIVALAVSVVVVALVSFALVGLSARARATATGEAGADGATASRPSMNPAVGTTVAGVCLLAVLAIVAYGLYIVIA